MDTIESLRTAAGLSRDELAKLAGLTMPTIWRIEAGKVEKLATLRRIAGVLGYDVEIRFVPRQVQA